MKTRNNFNKEGILELNLKSLLEKMFERKFFILAFLLGCLVLAYFYIKWETPKYKVDASVLIELSGKNQVLGANKYVEGGVGLLEGEKNLNNEINVLKSYNLVNETLKDLNFGVSYYEKGKYKDEEKYGYFPVEVEISDTSRRINGVPFNFKIISDEKYRLTVEAEEFVLIDPTVGSKREVKKPLSFSRTYEFGELVETDYFQFTVKQPEYKVILGEFEDKELFFVFRDLEKLTDQYLKKLIVEQSDLRATIVQLETEGPVVEKEVAFLDKLAKNYIDRKINRREEIAMNKENLIQRQLANVADSLRLAEQKVEAFKRQTQVMNFQEKASSTMSQVQILRTEKAQLERNITYYTSQLEYLRDSSGIDKISAPSVVGINDPLLNENLLELKNLYAEKSRKGNLVGAKSMDLGFIEEQIQNTKNSLQENLKNLIKSSQISLTDIDRRIQVLTGVINVMPSNEKQLLNYERHVTLLQDLYNYLSQELAKTQIARAENTPDIKVLDAPRMVGNGPVFPNEELIYGLAFILGLFIPIGWIVTRETFDEVIRNVDELEAVADIPVVASIARKEQYQKKHSSLAILNQWRVDESFRDLVAKLQFLVPDKKKNIIGITSTVNNEGKSFCAVNLARSAAKGGKKVMLVDLDLRKSGLIPSRRKDDQKKKGIADYLSNKNLPLSAVIHVVEDNSEFHYIPNLVEEENPQELLSSPRLETLLKELRERYDFVFVDSPALGLVSDYLFASKFVDAHLFLVRRNISKFSFLEDLEKLREGMAINPVYIVYNDMEGKKIKYGLSYYSKQGSKKKVN